MNDNVIIGKGAKDKPTIYYFNLALGTLFFCLHGVTLILQFFPKNSQTLLFIPIPWPWVKSGLLFYMAISLIFIIVPILGLCRRNNILFYLAGWAVNLFLLLSSAELTE